MQEKTYKLMGKGGAMSLVFGIVMIVVGTTLGVLMIINGAKLLSGRKKIVF